MDRIAVVGIHTGVGKTIVSAILTEALQATYWKPIQCGSPSDRSWVESHLSLPNHTLHESIFLKTPCSPHLAAKKEKVSIRANDIILPSYSGTLVIEGTGGILSPLNEEESWVDAANKWENTKWVLVHRHYLGALNHFFLSVEALRLRGISLFGVVFNGKGDKKTEEMLLKRAKTVCIGRLQKEKQWTSALLQQLASEWKPNLKSLGL